MPTLEEVGKILDAEIARLREILREEVLPSTVQAAIDALHRASRRLEELAEDLEKRAPGSSAGSR